MIIFVFELIVFSICFKDGSHLSSRVVLMVLTLIPEFSAQSLYAGHAGSITIISSPGLRSVDIAVKIENLAPGLTMMLSCVTLVLNLSETYFASASLKIGIPFA